MYKQFCTDEVRAHVESAFLEAECANLSRMGTSFQQALEHRMQLQINHITEGHKKRLTNTGLLRHYKAYGLWHIRGYIIRTNLNIL